MESLAEFIIKKREKAGLSITGLANKTNIKLEILEDIEAGKELFLSVTQRQQIARVLKISPKELKEYERSYEFQEISDDVIDNIKSQILNHKTDLRCPICGEPIDSDSVYIDDVEDEICYDCYEDKTCVDSFSNESHLVDNMDSLCILLGYDENEKPVYYDEWAYCYHPEDNWSYECVMTEAPKVENYHNYVTLDMIQPGKARDFANAFNIWFGWNKSIDLMNWYSNCIDEYNLYYDWNKNPLFDENDQMILF
jgi:ribosome-binding protein aMBF1 (putative translation factor)